MAKNDEKMAKIFKTQASLTEWYEMIEHIKTDDIRTEDGNKHARLEALNDIIDLPFEQPVSFAAADLAIPTPRLKKYLKEHGDEPCALRLIPKKDGVPKLRMRGLTVSGAMEWFYEQDIDPKLYQANFMSHVKCVWSTIFVVNDDGVYGEIIAGGHHQLTQGFHEDTSKLIPFHFDFETWWFGEEVAEATEFIKDTVSRLEVNRGSIRDRLAAELDAEFTQDYMMGYFEAFVSNEQGLSFQDYSQTLPSFSFVRPETVESTQDQKLQGLPVSSGEYEGAAKVVVDLEQDSSSFSQGDVLVAKMTTPAHVELMKIAGAIVTEQGGMLSHAAIVSRELGVPAVSRVKGISNLISNGTKLRIDGSSGAVTIL